MLVCNNCSASFQFLIENEKPSYKEPPKYVSMHIKELIILEKYLLNFKQKKLQIPDEVLENIKNQIKKKLNCLSYK